MAEIYDGTEGDDAVAAGLPVMDGTEALSDVDAAVNKTRDIIAQLAAGTRPIATGGTGATSAAGARTNLGAAAAGHGHDSADVDYSSLGGAASAPNVYRAVDGSLRVSAYDVEAEVTARLAKSGGTVTGGLYLPNATPATTSYVVCYINSDGRVSKGASSERFKKHISEIDPASLGDLFPAFKRFKMRGGDEVWRYGYTAEQLAANPETEPFVIYERRIEEDGTAPHLERDEHGNPIPESIDFIGFLLAQVAQLNARLVEMEGDEQ